MTDGTMGMQRRWAWGMLVGGVLIGCGPSPEGPAETGAKECVQGYYEAVIRKDWSRAYAALDPGSQQRCTIQQFVRLAQSYRSHLGFEPEAVQVRACEERGTEATGHVVLTGRAVTHHRRYKDAATLRRTDDWRVVLPPNFGQARKR
jgi:hypothetical protein